MEEDTRIPYERQVDILTERAHKVLTARGLPLDADELEAYCMANDVPGEIRDIQMMLSNFERIKDGFQTMMADEIACLALQAGLFARASWVQQLIIPAQKGFRTDAGIQESKSKRQRGAIERRELARAEAKEIWERHPKHTVKTVAELIERSGKVKLEKDKKAWKKTAIRKAIHDLKPSK